mgnify:CR=1 FL=1
MDEAFEKSLAALKKRAAEVGPISLPPQDGLPKKWLSLARADKIQIAERLGLATQEERTLDEFTYDRRVFLRVGGYSKHKELASEIDKAKSSQD